MRAGHGRPQYSAASLVDHTRTVSSRFRAIAARRRDAEAERVIRGLLLGLALSAVLWGVMLAGVLAAVR
jgi:hypothetical protein